MKNHETNLKNHGNQPKTMKNHETTLKNHGNQGGGRALQEKWKNVTHAGSQLTFQMFRLCVVSTGVFCLFQMFLSSILHKVLQNIILLAYLCRECCGTPSTFILLKNPFYILGPSGSSLCVLDQTATRGDTEQRQKRKKCV